LKDSDVANVVARSEGTSESLQNEVAGMKNVTDNESVAHELSEEELQRLAEYFSILREWSVQRSNLNDRDEGTSAPSATTSVDGMKAGHGAIEKRPQ
jgi:hypothetical protein